MKAFPRDRDVHPLVKGDAIPVSVSASLRASGWQGGQGVQWIDSDVDEFLVTTTDGPYGGFLLWGSNETADQLTSFSGNQPLYGAGILCTGTWLIATRTFERYTWASRQSGPLVANPYTASDRVVFSLRGWFTREDEFTLSGDPRAPNVLFVGHVVQAPSADNDFYLTVQTAI